MNEKDSTSRRYFVSRLLPWFGKNARDLPWRRTRDPYAIWVSEIMLQQTQVKTVIPYWQRWMETLPTIEALAKCRIDRVLKLWEGLGYYHRARNLQNAARTVMEQHNGAFPRGFEQVIQLPGIGRYTAGAICSIAFNAPAPVLDGNAIRVLTRFFGIKGDPANKETSHRLWALAADLVRRAGKSSFRNGGTTGNCSAFNQALMELGATACTAGVPNCARCPVARTCYARRFGCVERLPELRPRRKAEQRCFVALVIEQRGRLFLRQRPAGVVNAHLWEFPNFEISLRDDTQKIAGSIVGGEVRHLCTIRHTITRYRIKLEAFCSEPSCTVDLSEGKWVPLRKAASLAYPSAHRQVLERVLDQFNQPSRNDARVLAGRDESSPRGRPSRSSADRG